MNWFSKKEPIRINRSIGQRFKVERSEAIFISTSLRYHVDAKGVETVELFLVSEKGFLPENFTLV